jgi:hypothetical protein
MGDLEAMTLQNGFVMKNGFTRRIRVVDGLVRPVLDISRVEVEGRCSWIPSSVEFFSGRGDWFCRWLAFECGCKLSRLEEYTFYECGLTAIQIPASIEVISAHCFSFCTSLVSVTFAVDCKLSRLEANAFSECGLTAIHISE